jgi:hypothetical protein
MKMEFVCPAFLLSLSPMEDAISLVVRPMLIMDVLPATIPSRLHLPPLVKSQTAMATQLAPALAALKDML